MIKSILFKNSFLALIAICLSGLSAQADSYIFKSSAGKISFLAKGYPSAIKIKGQGKGPDGVLQENKGLLAGDLSFDLDSLDTGIEMRDKHMKEKYLEVSKYPKAQLKITDLKLATDEAKEVPFSGVLSLKGVEKPVHGTYSVSGSGSDLKTEVSFPLKLTDFKIDIPSYMGITVAEDVTVQVSSSVTRSH